LRKRAVLEKEGGPREKEDGPGVPHLRCAARVRAPMRARGRDRLGRPGAAVEHSHLRLPPALPPTKKRFWSNRCFGSVIYTGAPRSPPPPRRTLQWDLPPTAARPARERLRFCQPTGPNPDDFSSSALRPPCHPPQSGVKSFFRVRHLYRGTSLTKNIEGG
jgi:hypothetical protein